MEGQSLKDLSAPLIGSAKQKIASVKEGMAPMVGGAKEKLASLKEGVAPLIGSAKDGMSEAIDSSRGAAAAAFTSAQGSLESVFAGKSEKEIAQMKLLAGTGLCLFFMIAEVIGGIVAHSLAVMTDAAHMLSDVAGFLVGIMSLYLTSRAANSKYSFGFHIAEVLGALVSVSIVWLMTAMLVFEATNRLVEPEVVDGKVMFWVSLLGLAMNFVLMQVLGHGHGGHGGHGHGEHGHGHAEHGHAEHGHAEHGHAEHGHGEHGHGHAEHGHAEHGHAEHGHAEHGHAEHGHSTDVEAASHGHAHRAGEEHADTSTATESMALKAAMVHVIGDIVQVGQPPTLASFSCRARHVA